MSKCRYRVSRRELDLLCRYSLSMLNLPHGHVVQGAYLVAAAEIEWGSGLLWLLANATSIGATGMQAVAFDETSLVTSVDAGSGNLLSIIPSVMDYVIAAVRRRGATSLSIFDVAGCPLALALAAGASRRLNEFNVAIRYGALKSEVMASRRIVMPLMATASPKAVLKTCGAMVNIAPDAVGEVHLSVACIRKSGVVTNGRADEEPSGDSSQVECDYILVDRGVWSELLDLVGGILPPDGRGHLTSEELSDLHEAGPGEGVLHDDD